MAKKKAKVKWQPLPARKGFFYRRFWIAPVAASESSRVRVYRPVGAAFEFDFMAGIRCAVKQIDRSYRRGEYL